MGSRYDLMVDSTVTSTTDGTPYKDPLTFSSKEIRLENDPVEYVVTTIDIERFDLFVAKTYNQYNMYKDLLLQYNNISYQWDLESEDTILVPEKEDFNRFLRNNRE